MYILKKQRQKNPMTDISDEICYADRVVCLPDVDLTSKSHSISMNQRIIINSV